MQVTNKASAAFDKLQSQMAALAPEGRKEPLTAQERAKMQGLTTRANAELRAAFDQESMSWTQALDTFKAGMSDLDPAALVANPEQSAKIRSQMDKVSGMLAETAGRTAPSVARGYPGQTSYPGVAGAAVRQPVPASTERAAPAGANPAAVRAYGQGLSVFGGGIVTMSQMMALLQAQAFSMFDDLNDKTAAARDSQENANAVAYQISQLDPNNPQATTTLSPDVIAYMRANGIQVNGKSIDDFLKTIDPKATDVTKVALNKGDLAAVKAALESDSQRGTDFVQQGQLKIQQILQTFNIATQMANSLQSMGAEMNKQIASSIR